MADETRGDKTDISAGRDAAFAKDQGRVSISKTINNYPQPRVVSAVSVWAVIIVPVLSALLIMLYIHLNPDTRPRSLLEAVLAVLVASGVCVAMIRALGWALRRKTDSSKAGMSEFNIFLVLIVLCVLMASISPAAYYVNESPVEFVKVIITLKSRKQPVEPGPVEPDPVRSGSVETGRETAPSKGRSADTGEPAVTEPVGGTGNQPVIGVQDSDSADSVDHGVNRDTTSRAGYKEDEDSYSKPDRLKYGEARRGMYMLRSQPLTQSADEVKEMLKEHGFFDKFWNKSGIFDNEFIDNGDGTITDRATGLMWQKGGSDNYIPLADATMYVEQMNQAEFADYSDWRLPTLEELASLVEPVERNSRYIDPLFGPGQLWCWSADRRSSGGAWLVLFDRGNVDGYDYVAWVRLVRPVQ